ncbi:hypothetical protein [Microbacterium binotii]|uniref:Uncharacterized protein n=1 Tax=Microbacterium binotii TaxID=462710 RepID=A0ABN3PBL9_9MICO
MRDEQEDARQRHASALAALIAAESRSADDTDRDRLIRRHQHRVAATESRLADIERRIGEH